MLLEKGRITAVGKIGDVKIPPGTPALAVAEVTPGLIDAHSSVGLSGALNIQADQDQDDEFAQFAKEKIEELTLILNDE